MTCRFVLGYVAKPLHFFGRPAVYSILASLALFVYMLYDKFVYNVPISVAHMPLLALATILLMLGTVFVATGLIGEMISRVYFEATNKKIYSVRKVHRRESSTAG